MKKKLLILSSLALIGQFTLAQQIPNGDFESWNNAAAPDYDSPTDWNTVNNSVPNSQAWFLDETCFEESSDVHGGTGAVRLETVAPPFSGFPNVNGITTNGDINESSYEIENGIPYTFRPDSLVGWFKATPAGTDFATIEIVLKDALEDTIGWARFEAPNATVSSYTRFAAEVVYTSSANPVKAAVLLSASDGFNSVVGSELWVDDISLVFNPVGVNEIDFNQVSAYASNGRIYLNNTSINEGVEFNVIGLSGQVMTSGSVNSNSREIIAPNMANGLYFVRFKNGNQQKTIKLYFAN